MHGFPQYAASRTGMGDMNLEAEFSVDELACFERRYENGYDLTHDERYNLWLAMKYPGLHKG